MFVGLQGSGKTTTCTKVRANRSRTGIPKHFGQKTGCVGEQMDQELAFRNILGRKLKIS